jgi:hypothetical protein
MVEQSSWAMICLAAWMEPLVLSFEGSCMLLVLSKLTQDLRWKLCNGLTDRGLMAPRGITYMVVEVVSLPIGVLVVLLFEGNYIVTIDDDVF